MSFKVNIEPDEYGNAPQVQLSGSNAIVGGVRLTDRGGTSQASVLPVDIGDAQGLTANYGLEVGSAGYAYNGSTWDRVRNNMQGTLLASAARTAATTTATQTNYNAKGVIVWVFVSAASGTGGLIPSLLGYDPASAALYTMNAAPTAITTQGGKAFVWYPGVVSGSYGSNVAQELPLPLPRQWAVQINVGDSSSYTYSVAYSLIN